MRNRKRDKQKETEMEETEEQALPSVDPTELMELERSWHDQHHVIERGRSYLVEQLRGYGVEGRWLEVADVRAVANLVVVIREQYSAGYGAAVADAAAGPF